MNDYKVDMNIVKIKNVLTKIAQEQATREFSGKNWLEEIYKDIEGIDEKIIVFK